MDNKREAKVLKYNPVNEDTVNKNIVWSKAEVELQEDRMVWKESYTYELKEPDLSDPNSKEEQLHINESVFKRELCVGVALYYNRFPFQTWVVLVPIYGVVRSDQPQFLLQSKKEAHALRDEIANWIFNK